MAIATATPVAPNVCETYSNGDGTLTAGYSSCTGTISKPYAVVFSPAGAIAYIDNQGSDTVSIVDAAQNKIVKNIPVPGTPWGMAISPDGTLLRWS